MRIRAANIVDLNGTITANGIGRTGYLTHGGSGGGIYIVCRRFKGTNGQLSAIGGSTLPSPQGGGGGGGRIAVWRMTDQSSGWTATVAGGLAAPTLPDGSPGTIVWGWLPPPGTVFTIH